MMCYSKYSKSALMYNPIQIDVDDMFGGDVQNRDPHRMVIVSSTVEEKVSFQMKLVRVVHTR